METFDELGEATAGTVDALPGKVRKTKSGLSTCSRSIRAYSDSQDAVKLAVATLILSVDKCHQRNIMIHHLELVKDDSIIPMAFRISSLFTRKLATVLTWRTSLDRPVR